MDYYSHEWNSPLKKFFEDDFLGNFNSFFNGMVQQPRANVYESENEIICAVFLPGIKKVEDIHLTINDRTLEVRGNLNLDYNGFRLNHEEIYQGEFKRVMELPFRVRQDKKDASYQRGILTVHLYRLIPDNKSTHGVTVRDED
ncbi:Hsp20/alpha crystallin family protein [Salipaludibacillus daqingensis]|uniref:Hsp20/alpha crystallin family protein n=1 Tax=Salipaludibacillus daqingensis TaxID=3041001 RepID=UPI002476AD7B|nr:Hsp20/alpha crystallin family protein [Salipaludibacillus daqingensis]